MRQAMATCEVGDDVFHDDPTVIELEKLAAEMAGKEASLWCPTGTMANQVAIAAHTTPGKEVIAGSGSHIVNYELGGIGWNSFCQLHMIPDDRGWPEPEIVIDAFREETEHSPGTGLLCLENTHNRRGGRILPLDVLKICAEEAHRRGVPVHLDGARIWNASTASGVPVPIYAGHVDSMMFCLSKGLCSPAGSMLCGNSDFIIRARRFRKRMGGGLRQAGVLAACGLVSLTQMVSRLGDDHIKAKKLAEAISRTGVLEIDPRAVDTNICIFNLPPGTVWTATEFADAAAKAGLLVTYMAGKNIRMVTHNDFASDWIPEAAARVKTTAAKLDEIRAGG